jgi:hypothetical protein
MVQEIYVSFHKAPSSDTSEQKLYDIYTPILSDLNSRMMMLSFLSPVRPSSPQEYFDNIITKSKGQALRVALVKPVAYLSKVNFG